VVLGYDLVDLTYAEDSQASVDMNVVMNSKGELAEVQATAEGVPFPRKRLDLLLDLASKAIAEIIAVQREALQRIA
jgi:ribonuclease PH